MDSGITSRNATASMYPAPSAKKYCKYFRGQSRRTTKYPPTKFPAAATNPSPAASAVRNAKLCSMPSGTDFSLCLPPTNSRQHPKSRRHDQTRNCHSERSEESAFSFLLCVLCVSAFSSLLFIPNAGTKSHRPLAQCILFPRASPAPSPAPPRYSPPPRGRSTSPLPPE